MQGNQRIVIFSQHLIPYGGAQSNRIISYAAGLLKAGGDVDIFMSIPLFLDTPNKLKNGKVSGVEYKYFTTVNYSKSGAILKSIAYFSAFFLSLIELIKLRLKNRNLILIIQENRVLLRFFIALFGRIFGAKVFRDVSEYPNHILFDRPSTFLKVKSWINFFIEIYLLNGLFFMTLNIRDYYLKYSKGLKYMMLPMTVEPDRFICADNLKTEKYIAYCGSMYTDKDGVPMLIDAFNIIAEKYLDMKLFLIGDNSDIKKFEHLNTLIKRSKYFNRIIALGLIGRNEMPKYLCNATVLALSRPENKQAEGGFPTKLGEYLATGRPVVVTAVGEIPNYLKDGHNAYLCTDITADGFAKKLDYVLCNLSDATSVGFEGRKLAFSTFNNEVQAERLLKFIKR